MKARKPNETDEQYIRRLEDANRELRSQNKAWAQEREIYVDRARPAASFAGAVLNAAAEACGMLNDERVQSAREALEALAGLPWSKDLPVPEVFPRFDAPDPERNGGDCEMMVKSTLSALGDAMHPVDLWSLTNGLPEKRAERVRAMMWELWRMAQANALAQVRAATGASERTPLKPPKITTLAEAREVLADVWMAVGNALSDLEMSRSILRLDLRAAMYDGALREISDAVNRGWDAASHLPAAKAVFAVEF